jgi:hypothetical protein
MPDSPFTYRPEHHALPGASRGGSPLVPTHGSPGVPHTVWLPPRHAVTSRAVASSALPGWALERACAQFAPAGGPTALLLTPGPSHTERTARPTNTAPVWLGAAELVDLADVGRARLALGILLADPGPAGSLEPRPSPGFFAQIRAALRPGAVLLIHTHTAHTASGLYDPAGGLLHCARSAGFTYLQHLVLIHHRLSATSPRARRCAGRPDQAHRRVHTDLYALLHVNGET